MADKVKLGIIGYGHIGSQHGRAIRDGSLPDKENIAANVEATLRDMETSTPVEEGRPVHFPGAHMAEVRSDNMENGIPVEDAIWQQVLAL